MLILFKMASNSDEQLPSANSSPTNMLNDVSSSLQRTSSDSEPHTNHTAVPRRKLTCTPKPDFSEFNVHTLTWNIASAQLSCANIESLFLPQGSLKFNDLYNSTDILAVGLQEAYQSVQEAISSNVPLIGRDQLADDFSVFLADKGFARLTSCRLLGMLTLVFVKRPLLCYIHSVETATLKTGFNGFLGNKGSANVRFMLGELSVCFTNCHLCPHPENNSTRVSELKDIFERITFSDPLFPQPMDHDLVFLFGDLNFRLGGKGFDEVVGCLNSGKVSSLIDADQLRAEQIRGMTSESHLFSFMEMPLNFLPSYKYAPGTDEYDDGGKGRAPAWTDRILWYTHERRLPKITDAEPRAMLKPVYYGMHTQPRNSDHKAVSAGFKMSVDISAFSPKVVFHLNQWIAATSGLIAFDVMAHTEISMFDWIGLYPSNFSNLDRDYVFWSYSPARGNGKETRTYSKKLVGAQVPEEGGLFILVYKSVQYGCVLGMSPIFRIEVQRSSPGPMESSTD